MNRQHPSVNVNDLQNNQKAFLRHHSPSSLNPNSNATFDKRLKHQNVDSDVSSVNYNVETWDSDYGGDEESYSDDEFNASPNLHPRLNEHDVNMTPALMALKMSLPTRVQKKLSPRSKLRRAAPPPPAPPQRHHLEQAHLSNSSSFGSTMSTDEIPEEFNNETLNSTLNDTIPDELPSAPENDQTPSPKATKEIDGKNHSHSRNYNHNINLNHRQTNNNTPVTIKKSNSRKSSSSNIDSNSNNSNNNNSNSNSNNNSNIKSNQINSYLPQKHLATSPPLTKPPRSQVMKNSSSALPPPPPFSHPHQLNIRNVAPPVFETAISTDADVYSR